DTSAAGLLIFVASAYQRSFHRFRCQRSQQLADALMALAEVVQSDVETEHSAEALRTYWEFAPAALDEGRHPYAAEYRRDLMREFTALAGLPGVRRDLDGAIKLIQYLITNFKPGGELALSFEA